MVIGVALGVLITIISGFVVYLLLPVARRSTGHVQLLAITGQLLALPTFWFGGPWATGVLLGSVHMAEILPAYIVTLAVAFGLITAYGLARLIIAVGNQIGTED